MTITTALKEALNDAITSGKFIDTKIVLFSRRDSSGKVYKPKALYANSHVLKTIPYFNAREFPLCPLCGVLNDPFLEYFLANFRNRRSRTLPRPLTMASSQRTTDTPRIVTLKRIGILRVPLPRMTRRNLTDKKLCTANTKNMFGWARLSGSKTWLSLRAFT